MWPAAVSSPIARAQDLSHIELNKLQNAGSICGDVNSQIKTLCGTEKDSLEPFFRAENNDDGCWGRQMNGTGPMGEKSRGLRGGAPGVDDKEHMMPN